MDEIKTQDISIVVSDSIGHILTALNLAQAEMESAKKDANNPFFKSKYADYASVWDAVKGPLTKHGLSYLLLPHGGPTVYKFTGILGHKSGEYIKTTIMVSPADNKIQTYGSLMTYVKRYMLTSLTGVAVDEDDDGNLASQRVVPPQAKQPPQPTAQPQQAAPQRPQIKNHAPGAVTRPGKFPDYLKES